MESKRWGMRLAGAGVWAVAALTWGSIAHHLWGLPDAGLVMAIVAVALMLALPLRRTERAATDMISTALVDHTG